MDNKTIVLEDGTKITMQKPTRQQALAYSEKRDLSRRNQGGALDDGDEEILACITHPSPEEMDEILADYPLLTAMDLATMFEELAGAGVTLNLKPTLLTPELKAQNKRIVGYEVDGLPLVAKKLSRMEIKFFQREYALKKTMPYKHLSGFGETHVLPPFVDNYHKLVEKYPMFPISFGSALISQAMAKLQDDEKK